MEQELFIDKVFESFDHFQILKYYSKQSFAIWTTFNSKNSEDEEDKYKFKFSDLK